MTRLNKFISESGCCSRRAADALIARGAVRINGQVAVVGTQVGPNDRVEVEGRVIRAPAPESAVYIAYHKPVGIICVTDPKVRDNIVSAVRHPRRIFPIGRLDVASEGLIFLTSDGDVVNKILRAGNAHEKEYEVTVNRPIDPEFVRRMSSGVPILDTVTLPCKVRPVSTHGARNRFTIILTQGLNRQIRRMCEHQGYEVSRLRRTRIMNVRLADLPLGPGGTLTPAELTEIRRLIATSSGTEEASQRPDDGD